MYSNIITSIVCAYRIGRVWPAAEYLSRRQPLREPLFDRVDAIRLPFVVLAHRDLEVVAVGRELDRQLVRDEFEGAGIDRPVVEPLVELGLRLGLRGELDELPGELAV